MENRIRRLEEMGLDLKGRVGKEEVRRAWVTQNALYFFTRVSPQEGITEPCCEWPIRRTLYLDLDGTVRPLIYSDTQEEWIATFTFPNQPPSDYHLGYDDIDEENWYLDHYPNGVFQTRFFAASYTCPLQPPDGGFVAEFENGIVATVTDTSP